MESGFGQNLEGFLIKGNLSLLPTEVPLLHGDGSIEGSGTLYINRIQEYDIDNGVDIQGVILKNQQVYIPYTHPSTDRTRASFIIDGGVSINHTSNSTSITSGGALTIAGGVSVAKNANIGGILNMNTNKIINVPLPVDGTDAVNKDYVDSVADRVSGDFTTGQIIIAASDGDAIRGYDFLKTDTQRIYAGIPLDITSSVNSSNLSTASLVLYGGASILKDVNVGGTLYMNGNAIKNVVEPTADTDVATKYYVDNKTFGNILGDFLENQVLIGTTDPNRLIGTANLTFNGDLLNLGGKFLITDTTNATNLTSASFVAFGGVSIGKNLFVGGTTDLSNNKIVNLATPTNPYDAATKEYVDTAIENSVSGVFTTGQLLIGADSIGKAIRGYDNLTLTTDGTSGTFNISNLTDVLIANSTNASGVGTGGALTILGGASIEKNVYIGGGLDVNVNRITSVNDPIQDLDAVNKRYVDNIISTITQNISTNSFTLNNNVVIPEDIPNFFYPAYARAFLANVYVQCDLGKYAIFTLYGYKCGSSWYLLKTFVGDPTGVEFLVRSQAGQAIIQYTNANTAGITSIRYTNSHQINDLENTNQINYTLLPNTTTFTDILPLTYLNSEVTSAKFIIYASSDTDSKCGMYMLSCVQKAGTWVLHVYRFGETTGIDFQIASTGTTGVIQYTNSNSAADYTLRIRPIKISDDTVPVTLTANTVTPTPFTIPDFIFSASDRFFQLTVYAENPTTNKYALYELQGAIHSDTWKMHARYIGDNLGIKFSVSTGTLCYTNSEGSDAFIRYIASIPLTFLPLPVNRGGTGKDYLNPFAVLRGNGSDPIVATDDFIYKDYKLILGNLSSIVLENTQNATGLGSGGTLISSGGASFLKDVYIGGKLDVNLNNIKSVADPIDPYDAVNKRTLDEAIDLIDFSKIADDPLYESTLYLDNNVTTAKDIPNFCFPLTTKAFISNILVSVNESQVALYTIRGINSGTSWVLSSSFTGQPTGVTFSLHKYTDKVCVQYTNTNVAGSTFIKYRVSSRVEDTATTQVNYTLNPNVTDQTIPGMTFLNNLYKSVKLIVYVSSETRNQYGLFLCNFVLKNNLWDFNSYSIGNVTGINFSIDNGTSGQVSLRYTNENSESDYTVRIRQLSILESETSYTLAPATVLPSNISTTDLSFQSLTDNYFLLSVYVYVPSLSRYALYEIQGLLTNGIWSINSRYIGDYTGVKFYITTVNNVGYLTYTNSNATQAFIKVVRDIPLTTLKPLSVSKGGTSSTYLTPHAVLRGNGVNQIIGTNDFVYENNQLILGNYSSIVLQNTQVSNGTTGTLVAYGGITVNKNLTVGDALIVKTRDITPSIGDINEREFSAQNNQVTPQNITGFDFTNAAIKSFSGIVCTTVTTTIDEMDALYEIKGIKKRTGWVIYSSSVGDNVGINFTITSSGQVQYTSTNVLDWTDTKMKFRAITTSV